MKQITIEMPEDVDVVAITYFSSGVFDSWVLASAFQPKDGMTVNVISDGTKHNYVCEYAEVEET